MKVFGITLTGGILLSFASLLSITPLHAGSATWALNPVTSPDGATILIGINNYSVDYEGGDGNDLTLIVVP
jgi:hypothetical protein